jgi:hypothetical protein
MSNLSYTLIGRLCLQVLNKPLYQFKPSANLDYESNSTNAFYAYLLMFLWLFYDNYSILCLNLFISLVVVFKKNSYLCCVI